MLIDPVRRRCSPPAHTTTTLGLLVGSEKGLVLPDGAAQQRNQTRAQGPEGSAWWEAGLWDSEDHPQLPKAKFNFPDLAGGDGAGNSGAQGEGRKAQVGMLVPTGCKQSSGRPARAGSRVCMA